ncbi:chalcone isomerase family protein [Shewanella waksmanii]|uniref:chalcone isomerase family protein n=1 Tax=Shewanella waksmanii TaxID=213783 RepID=UPI00373529B0
MKSLSTAALLIAGLLTSQTHAANVAGIELAEKIQPEHSELVLNGAGVRSKFFIDLYVGSLYVSSPSQQLDEILSQPEVAVRLNITSGMITSDKMQDAINEGFDDATDGNTDAIKQQITTFMALFADEIKQGDQFTLVATKDLGVTAYKNGKLQDTVKGEAFRQALLKIWLGDQPAQKSLKKAMLNQ